jgi:hypothetical protein
MSATYTKLKDGSWGIRVEGDRPVPGEAVTVKTRFGNQRREQVETVLWSGGNIHLCTVCPRVCQCDTVLYYGKTIKELVETSPSMVHCPTCGLPLWENTPCPW